MENLFLISNERIKLGQNLLGFLNSSRMEIKKSKK